VKRKKHTFKILSYSVCSLNIFTKLKYRNNNKARVPGTVLQSKYIPENEPGSHTAKSLFITVFSGHIVFCDKEHIMYKYEYRFREVLNKAPVILAFKYLLY
jgi:hypothetical protein